MEFDPQAFQGTAQYYAAGRPPYSEQLAATMRRELSLDGTGQLLDVGCGPGVVVLELAGLFSDVVAVDPVADMLDEGRHRCEQAGISHVRWVRAIGRGSRRVGSGPVPGHHVRPVVPPGSPGGGRRRLLRPPRAGRLDGPDLARARRAAAAGGSGASEHPLRRDP